MRCAGAQRDEARHAAEARDCNVCHARWCVLTSNHRLNTLLTCMNKCVVGFVQVTLICLESRDLCVTPLPFANIQILSSSTSRSRAGEAFVLSASASVERWPVVENTLRNVSSSFRVEM